jgi:transposase-like protein
VLNYGLSSMALRKIQLAFYDCRVTCPYCKTALVFTSPEQRVVLASRTCPKCGKGFVIENDKAVRRPSRKPPQGTDGSR